MAQEIFIIDFYCKARFSSLLFYFTVLYCSIVGCVLVFVFDLAKNCPSVSEFTRISCLSTPRFDAHIPPNATGGRPIQPVGEDLSANGGRGIERCILQRLK